MNLQQLQELSVSGVWGFVNHTDRCIFITHSNNILTSVSRNISQIEDKTHTCRRLLQDKSKLELVILDTNLSSKDRRIRVGDWMTYYRFNGYSLYRDSTVVSYKIRVVITKEYLIHVLLVNKRNDKIVIGVFNKMELANNFIQSTYPNNKVHKVIYSENSLTKEFLNRSMDIRM